jgi:hypothetical protein
LSKHKVLIDCAKKSIKVTTLDGKVIEFVAESIVTAKGIVNHANVPMVNKFPDVFPKELPGMPPD